MLGLERERVGNVGIEVGGALAGDPVDEIERDVVASGIPKSVHGAPDVVRRGTALEHREQVRPEALRAERDPIHATGNEELCELGRDRLRVRLHGQLLGRRKRREQPLQLRALGEGRSAAAEEDGLYGLGENVPLERELGEQRVDVRGMLPAAPDDGHEVAVPAAMRAEGQVHVEVTDARVTAFAPGRG